MKGRERRGGGYNRYCVYPGVFAALKGEGGSLVTSENEIEHLNMFHDDPPCLEKWALPTVSLGKYPVEVAMISPSPPVSLEVGTEDIRPPQIKNEEGRHRDA